MKLFVFDHCPFCVKAMMVAGLKKIDLDIVYLQNHDVDARIEKVGANMVPILQKPDGSYMAESLDIVIYLDALDNKPLLMANKHQEDIARYQEAASPFSSRLLYPRWLMIDLPEFQCQEAKDWFRDKKTKMIEQDFDDAFARSEEYLDGLNQALAEHLNWLRLPSERNNELACDDINLFPFLRNLTVIKGVEFPSHVRKYIDEVAALTGIGLYDHTAV